MGISRNGGTQVIIHVRLGFSLLNQPFLGTPEVRNPQNRLQPSGADLKWHCCQRLQRLGGHLQQLLRIVQGPALEQRRTWDERFHGDFHSHGGSPVAGWFVIRGTFHIDDLGVALF